MTILFLDIDGVLNCLGTRTRNPVGTIGLDPERVKVFQRILTETDCCVVLSSTWRKTRALEKFVINELDIADRYAGRTVDSSHRRDGSLLYIARQRGDEIKEWLGRHPEVTSFVILDDDSDMGELLPHLLKTDITFGLTQEIADEAIRRLKI